MNVLPYSLLTAITVQPLCQLFKLVYYSIRDKRFSPKYLVTAGGAPSSHSAFVTSLSVSVGLQKGFLSDIFAVSFVFSAIVIYDAYRLRGAVQNHAVTLNEMLLSRDPGAKKLSEMVGHSIPEIVVGILVGSLGAAAMNLAILPFIEQILNI